MVLPEFIQQIDKLVALVGAILPHENEQDRLSVLEENFYAVRLQQKLLKSDVGNVGYLPRI